MMSTSSGRSLYEASRRSRPCDTSSACSQSFNANGWMSLSMIAIALRKSGPLNPSAGARRTAAFDDHADRARTAHGARLAELEADMGDTEFVEDQCRATFGERLD